ncbi:MAG TPA: Ig-like domain-containing protein [Candidatus Methanofastidiosum sp.]|nr:Ig-like domain-containing protein [Methanofastidiosum sp.]
MMKFFRKHRKAVSPVIATMLLVAVAVAAVGAYFIWFRSFQTQSQGSVQEAASGALGSEVQVANIANDGNVYYISLRNASSKDVNVTAVKRGTQDNASDPDGITHPEILIPTGTTSTVLFNPRATLTRGSTYTFTIEYLIKETDASGVVVHTYTNS